MSGHLWKLYFEDDVDAFRHLLETSSYNARSHASKTFGFGQSNALGSPGSLGSSPTLLSKTRRGAATTSVYLSRADVNSKDALGLTILHYAASSTSPNALGFALALLEHPMTDIYGQDIENGWTPLHRAFYFGNVAIARLILERERRSLLGYGSGGHSQHAGGLIKIKDKEGNGPFDLFAMSITDRIIHDYDDGTNDPDAEDEGDDTHVWGEDDDDGPGRKDRVRPHVNIQGDGVFTFGSNKNVTLGFGDEDDRQNPERIILRRPDHLLQRFYREHLEQRFASRTEIHNAAAEAVHSTQSFTLPVTSLPTTVRATPLVIQDVQMSKLHTAVLTADPESNLYMCGHGPGGRLGTGSETTRFQFTCIEGGALAGKRVVIVGLGQNHSLALSSEGEIFSWGSNLHGQLGYTLPKTAMKDEEPIQTLPRQIFGPLKKEIVTGVAASRIHSVVHTSSSLYTFGKNEGQLGIMDSDARSLEIQLTPRKIAASLFSCNIHSVAAIDKATVCLLENHDVWVFANYGYSKIMFPLDGFANYFLKTSFLTTKYEKTPNRVNKITAGGDTICALSSSGEIFTVAVRSDPAPEAGTSTTNPTKIRGALSTPVCVWSAKKTHMAAKDVGVDQDGSIILTTEAGSVWRRTKRASIKDATASGTGEYKPKDYKFARIPGLTRVSAVRSSSFGAYAAIRKDSDVTRTQIEVDEPTLWADLAGLCPLYSFARAEDSEDENPAPRFWGRPAQSEVLQRRVLATPDLEKELAELLSQNNDGSVSYDAKICTTTSELTIPVHQFILAGRSKVLREATEPLETGNSVSIPDILELTRTDDGRLNIKFIGLDFLTIFNLVLYLYTDTIVSFWQFARQAPKFAFRYRQIRTELMKISSRLELRQLEPAARQMVPPRRSMHLDFEMAIKHPSFFSSGDIAVQLSDGEMRVHSAVLCQRSPFFDGMFNGRAGGMWLSGRRDASELVTQVVDVDFSHVSKSVFQLVLRHVYAEAEEDIFDHIISDDLSDHIALDELLDLAIEVMGAANELMITRLSQICQRFIGRYVYIRNVCSLLNAIAPCAVTEFKDAALEYVCLNLEATLQGGILDELDEDLMSELDQTVRDNQLACLPIARSGRAEALLFERYPDLAERIHKSKRAKIDAIVLSNKFADFDRRGSTSFRAQSLEEISATPPKSRSRRKSHRDMKIDEDSPANTPRLRGKPSTDLLFDMDDDDGASVSVSAMSPSSPRPRNPDQSPNIDAIPFSLSQPKLSLESPMLSLEVASATRFAASSSGRPWGAAPLTSKKLDMKDIMAQTSTDHQSGISLAISSQPRAVQKPSGSFHVKPSQKERKRQQQNTPLADTPPSRSLQTDAPASPWSSSKITGGATHDSRRRSTTPHLTMRQTIANPGPTAKLPSIHSPSPQATPQRSVSGPAPDSPSSYKNRPPQPSTSTSAQAALAPRSIRHTPMPDRSAAALPGQSMHSILSQQQAEKDYINMPEKRSMQEIQQEQEFQQWWDAESRRVKQEEEDRNRKEKAANKRGRPKIRGNKTGTADKKDTRTKNAADGAAAENSVTGSKSKLEPAREKKSGTKPSRDGASRGGHNRGRGGRPGDDRGKRKEAQEKPTPSTNGVPTASR